MYHPTTSSSQYSSPSNEHANAITPSTWFVNLYFFKPIEDTLLPSKLELLFLLDSGASICVLNLPTFTTLADHFLKCSKCSPQNDEFKTSTVANETEVPLLHKVILTLHTSIHGSTGTLVISFAVANIKYIILGTPFLEKFVKILNIENTSLTFNTPHESRVNTLPFTAHKEKNTLFFISTILRLKIKSILNQTPLKLSIFQFNLLFLYFFKRLITKLYFLPLLTYSLTQVSIPLLIFSKYIKRLKLNLIVVLLLFKISLIILPSSTQDKLDISKFPQLILNLSTTNLMM